MHVLMAWGDFRFSIATIAYEELTRAYTARIAPQHIIGARPSLHMMGWEAETIGLSATIFPFHLPGNRGLEQLHGLRAAVGTSEALIGNARAMGTNLDTWALKSVGETQGHIHPDGTGQRIVVRLEFLFDGRARAPEARSAIARMFG
ncbi:phage tail protein [Roseospira goensis]|uniref:Phage tail protein n=1 Tax=Roseospira goensis TaxID=391922 RepID=A0A7W6WM92_9PROT|nr:phage tail protein [Roseospira goensis]MBB4287835.1 hypothetical protein [Roseospira goensis]